jgi:uncharacterized protein involved in exopolysaccharide biosynthesis
LNKPIIEEGYFNLTNLMVFLRKHSASCLKYSLYITLIFVVYFFAKTPTYSSKITFYTNYNDVKQSSLLSPFLGDIANLDQAGLNFSISEYLQSDRFLKNIIQKKYMINEEDISLIDYWGVHYNNYLTLNPFSFLKTINRNIMFAHNLSIEERRISFAKEVLSGSILHSENRRSGLNTVKVIIKEHPSLSKQITKEIYFAVLDYANQINNIKANEKIAFIEDRLVEVQFNLKKSEEKLLEFEVQNKNFRTSPTLLLEKNRIQRDINAYNQVYLSLLDQFELAKIDSKDNTNSVFYLDREIQNSSIEGLGLIQGILFVFVGTFIIMLFHKLHINRLDLFK